MKRYKNILVGGLIGYVGGAMGLHLSHTMDKAEVNWFLLPMSIVLCAVLYSREANKLDD